MVLLFIKNKIDIFWAHMPLPGIEEGIIFNCNPIKKKIDRIIYDKNINPIFLTVCEIKKFIILFIIYAHK